MSESHELTPDPSDPAIDGLKPFLDRNPYSRAEHNGDKLAILAPWGDSSVSFQFSDNAQSVIDVLNSVFLPRPYCAIWHTDSHDIEFIWSPVPSDPDLIGRSFLFVYEGKEVSCGFDHSSDRLHVLAKHSDFGFDSDSDYRNMLSFQRGLEFRADNPQYAADMLPSQSFWIRSIEWDDEYVAALCRHINFYMLYFDRNSPHIIELTEMSRLAASPGRYLYSDSFPSKIKSQRLNPDLMHLIHTARRTADPIRCILHSYQVLEYVAHYYVKEDTYRLVRRMLMSPNISEDMNVVMDNAIDLLSTTRLEESQRMQAVLKKHVDPKTLWPIIEQYRDVFSANTTFDGGHTEEKIIDSKDGISVVDSSMWIDSFVRRWTNLRNVIVHAREQRHSQRISPTASNLRTLFPWSVLFLAAAEQLVAYENR